MPSELVVGENSENRGTRKRMKRKTKREQEYEARYKMKDPHLLKFEPPCEHREGRFRCCAIPVNVLHRAKGVVLAIPKKEEQDKRLSFLMNVRSPKRRRVRGEKPKNNPTSTIVNYHLRSGKEEIPVCARFFRKFFGVGVSRVMTIAKGIQSGKGVQDKRGGDYNVGNFQVKRRKVTK